MPRPSANLEAFEAVRDQFGTCGIWCGSCVVGNGTLRELSIGYRQLIENYGLPKWGPSDVDYQALAKGLESLERVPLCPGCGRGGGRDDCELRSCAATKRIESCAECSEPKACPHAELRDHMRSGAVAAGLLVESGSAPSPQRVEHLCAELRDTWPACVLFARGASNT